MHAYFKGVDKISFFWEGGRVFNIKVGTLCDCDIHYTVKYKTK